MFVDKKFFEKASLKISLAALIFLLPIYTSAQISDAKKSAIKATEKIASEILPNSYPEIKSRKIRYKTFESDSNFFKARFSYGRFLTFQRMRHLIYVNPKVFKQGAPEKGIQAILAHELAHVLYYTKKNRLELLGLASLMSKSFTQKFERKADLEAISRGYGEGLIIYRRWLYKNIPQKKLMEKKRNYFSPEEIELMIDVLKSQPKKIGDWKKKVPLNMQDIRNSV